MTSSVAPRISCNTLYDDGDARPGQDTARIFNIQRYSLNDGGGIRTVVFFKGCPHICPWCANPESMSPRIHTVRREAKCLHCTPCLNDADECPAAAMERIGRQVTLDELLKEVLKDDVFYRASGGGVTLSGGEVLMQAAFATRFLERLQALGIHTAMETAGDAPANTLTTLAGHCNQVLFDLKIMDPQLARTILNINQQRVQENFALLVARGIDVIPRLPLIPGYTLSEENLRRALDFLAPFKLKELHLLPFHQFGEAKYRLLNRDYAMRDVPAPDEQEITPLREMAQAAGYHVVTGG
ncbi:[formate-C-acetyltransferase]-activating enzyme [Enterobacillus tribolii]|uniref:Pyruvate formate lyase activating enzyme n=1 Tax=Enterobacillus tribolii TaxID=1487935 RepID=A0A370QAV4_9GAMM|nr:[formate-C-acetyltransferase]-activating enzyme [Enterobacillus tribolii]MBW7984468.1 [formate-C-acetyltransferase]-activating enzyme [Enterobacillus tribolii]RDK85150.1 pyruvate formate lyase activating enzyme [Enterobacillus tribolii]